MVQRHCLQLLHFFWGRYLNSLKLGLLGDNPASSPFTRGEPLSNDLSRLIIPWGKDICDERLWTRTKSSNNPESADRPMTHIKVMSKGSWSKGSWVLDPLVWALSPTITHTPCTGWSIIYCPKNVCASIWNYQVVNKRNNDSFGLTTQDMWRLLPVVAILQHLWLRCTSSTGTPWLALFQLGAASRSSDTFLAGDVP